MNDETQRKPPTTEELVRDLRARGYFVREDPNRYDRADMVDRRALLRAGGLKIGAYRVRDPETDEWGVLQFHMTYDNTVIAVASEEAAKLFARYVMDTLGREDASRASSATAADARGLSSETENSAEGAATA